MNVNKFLKWFGLLFVMLGLVIGTGLLVESFLTHIPSLAVMGCFFYAMFCGIGGFFAAMGIKALRRDSQITEHGTAYLGKIFDHVPDYQVTVNGSPTVSLIVRYMQGGVIRQATVRTGTADPAAFPRGATVTISLLDGEAALVPGSVTDRPIPDEENLLNPDFDPQGIESSIGVSCPSCGAMLTVPIGMATICPYCGRKVTVGKDGSIH